MSSGLAPHACSPCKTLKRKCFRELPSCSLCLRLGKECSYVQDAQRMPMNSGQDTGLGFDQESFLSININKSFPSLFLLDSNAFSKSKMSMLDPGAPVPEEVLSSIQVESMSLMLESFFHDIHPSLPFLSKKRLSQDMADFDTKTSASLAIFILSVKLVTEPINLPDSPEMSKLYETVKEYVAKLENNQHISLRLLQTYVLIGLYELGHGVFPAAYLTISHAARLGILMGFQDRRNAAQLLPVAPTWTLREEERRTWWAIFTLDRYVNIGTSGSILATPEPNNNDLLPCSDHAWDRGDIASSQAVFSSTAAATPSLGGFGSICQAAHLLGQVERHRSERSGGLDKALGLSHALQLHRVLDALDSDIQERYFSSTNALSQDRDNITGVIAYTLCCSSRLILYNMYGCNEPDQQFSGDPRIQEESEMQQISLEGIKSIVFEKMIQLVRNIQVLGYSPSTPFSATVTRYGPLICYCIYHVSSECAWFIREDKKQQMIDCLSIYVDWLKTINSRWKVAGLYLRLLEHEGALECLPTSLS